MDDEQTNVSGSQEEREVRTAGFDERPPRAAPNTPWSIWQAAQPRCDEGWPRPEQQADRPEHTSIAPSPDGPPPLQDHRPHSPRRHRWFATIGVGLTLLAVGAFLGVAIAHDFWLSHDRAVAQTPSASGANGFPFNGGSLGANGSPFFGGGSGSSNSGGSPFNGGSSGNSGGSPFIGGSGSQSSGGSVSSAAGGPSNVSAIAAKVDSALVDVNMTEADGSSAAATGIVLTPTGLVLTNNHVVDGATAIEATDLGSGRTYSATVLGYDPSADVALMQLQGASGLATARLGYSASASAGQPVVAIGNAGGTGGTPSAAGGKIGALDQQITASDAGGGASERLSGLIETNADIQSGDSGGPLVSTSGQVLAMITAASSGYSFGSLSSGHQGYAIPIDTATALASQIESGQSSAAVHVGPTAFLGVEAVSSADQGGFGSGGSSGSGALIVGVLSGSPAAQAGLAAGDTIVSVDGHTVDSPETLTAMLGRDRPGQKVAIGWLVESGGRHTSSVALVAGPAH